jgi:hypothetical protein
MPDFWNTLAPAGIVFGNAGRKAPMRVQNTICISSPGYEEMMTGAPRPEIAATILQHFGLPPTALDAKALPPLPGTFAPM